MPVSQQIRSLREIAKDVREHWPKVYFGTVPYLEAMEELEGIDGMYHFDSAESVVIYFLSNAATWRGEHARRIKAELRGMLK